MYENAVRAAGREKIKLVLNDKFRSINYFANEVMFYGGHDVVGVCHS